MSFDREFREDDEQEEYAPRSIFAAGWFRAVLVMTLLAIAVVVALPYLLDWFEPVPAPVARASKPLPGASAPADSQPSTSGSPDSSAAVSGKPSDAQPVSSALKPAGDAPRTAALTPSIPSRDKPVVSRQPRASAAMPGAERVTRAQNDGSRRSLPSGYWVQLGLFKDEANAERLAGRLRERGFAIQVARLTRDEAAARGVRPGAYHVVRAGAFASPARATAGAITFS